MKALSIRQPWAHFILHYGKDIENRNWPTKVRGRILIHAAKGMTLNEFEDACECAEIDAEIPQAANLLPTDFERGGIVGSVEIIDCVTKSDSPWFYGEYGFVLRNPRYIPFIPYKGKLGFFYVPAAILTDEQRREHI